MGSMRLASSDLPFLRPSKGPLGHIDFCGWLSRDLLWIEGWSTADTSSPIEVQWRRGSDRQRVESSHRFRYSRPDLADIPGALAQILVLPVDADLQESSHLSSIWVQTEDRWYRWSRYRGVGIASNLVTFFEHRLVLLPREIGVDLVGFLLEECLGESQLANGDDPLRERNVATAQRLFAFMGWTADSEEEPSPEHETDHDEGAAPDDDEAVDETGTDEEATPDDEAVDETETDEEAAPNDDEAVDDTEADEGAAPDDDEAVDDTETDDLEEGGQEPLPAFFGEPEEPLGMCVDRFIAIDDEHLFVQGWLWNVEDAVLELSLKGPNGCSVDLMPAMRWLARPSITERFSPYFAEQAVGHHGFLATVRCPEAIEHPGLFRFELSVRDRPPIRVGHPALVSDPFLARDMVFLALPPEPWIEVGLLEEQIHPLLERLLPRCRERVRVRSTTAFGPEPNPSISVVITLGDRIEMVEPQLASFSDDPDLAECEIVYVLDHTELSRPVERLLFECHRIYDLPPIRLVVTDCPVGHAAAVNLGVGESRGRTLVLLHADVIADRPGWLAGLLKAYRDLPQAGPVGPRLLYEDRSLQHAGIRLVNSIHMDGLWTGSHRYKGFPENCPPANRSGPVAAVSDACLLVAREVFEELGGYSDSYAVGDGENLDLCLRAAAAGRETWYAADVTLFHLEGLTKPWGPGWKRNPWTELYNRWLLSRRWGDLLEKRAAASD